MYQTTRQVDETTGFSFASGIRQRQRYSTFLSGFRAMLCLGILMTTDVSDAEAPDFLIDDFSSAIGVSLLGTSWRFVSDQVMGGVSDGTIAFEERGGRRALCLTGQVSLANNGGFIQANLDLAANGLLDARRYAGVRFYAWGNGENYNVHLKTRYTRLPWQSYRADFRTADQWRLVQLPFDAFTPHRLDRGLDTGRLRRIGIVAIGKSMTTRVCIAEIGFYSGE